MDECLWINKHIILPTRAASHLGAPTKEIQKTLTFKFLKNLAAIFKHHCHFKEFTEAYTIAIFSVYCLVSFQPLISTTCLITRFNYKVFQIQGASIYIALGMAPIVITISSTANNDEVNHVY